MEFALWQTSSLGRSKVQIFGSSLPRETGSAPISPHRKQKSKSCDLLLVDASVHDETNQKLKLKPDSIRDA